MGLVQVKSWATITSVSDSTRRTLQHAIAGNHQETSPRRTEQGSLKCRRPVHQTDLCLLVLFYYYRSLTATAGDVASSSLQMFEINEVVTTLAHSWNWPWHFWPLTTRIRSVCPWVNIVGNYNYYDTDTRCPAQFHFCCYSDKTGWMKTSSHSPLYIHGIIIWLPGLQLMYST